jgi:hypothetical protein
VIRGRKKLLIVALNKALSICEGHHDERALELSSEMKMMSSTPVCNRMHDELPAKPRLRSHVAEQSKLTEATNIKKLRLLER